MTVPTGSSGVVQDYVEALAMFGDGVHRVGPDDWARPTPCSDWDVRALVRHLVEEALWVPPLLEGQTVEQVGDRFSGDVLGEDPVAAWEAARAAAEDAVRADGALDRRVHLSYGLSEARHYVEQMTDDYVVHAWDLARGTGADDALDPRLVHVVHARTAPRADELAQPGLFGPRIAVPDDADEQTRLLAMFGRRR